MLLEDRLDRALRRREDALPIVDLQVHLILDLLSDQAAVRGLKAATRKEAPSEPAAGDSESDVGDSVPHGDNGNDSATDERDSPIFLPGALERSLDYYRVHQRAVRDLGDGIAWRAFDYDRPVLRSLAGRGAASRILSEGLDAELYEFARGYDVKRGMPIFNGLTHFLTYGDVTIKLGDAEFEIVEVKARNSGGKRVRAQGRDLRRVVELLNERSAESGQLIGEFADVEVAPRTFVKSLGRALSNAGIQGHAYWHDVPHIVAGVLDFAAGIERHASFEECIASMEKAEAVAEGWSKAGDLVVPFHLEDRYRHVQNFAPLSIFPLPVDQRVKLMTGVTLVKVWVNFSKVMREFENRGWRIVRGVEELGTTIEATKEFPATGPEVAKAGLRISVPMDWLARVGLEVLAPQTLVAALEAVLAKGPTAAKWSMLSFTGESKAWD
jgi:hypothetical protein